MVNNAQIFIYAFTFIFGAVIGSFLNVCVYRLPRGESVVFPPSHCTSCGSGIRFYHNIPILSYLFLGAKCAYCGSIISPMYPFVELLTGLLMLGAAIKFGLSLSFLFLAIFICALIVITFIDLEHMIIPNVISIPGIAAGLLYNILITDWKVSLELLGYFKPSLNYFLALVAYVPAVDSIAGIILGGGVLLLIAVTYEFLRKREGMGMGDVKLLAMIGAFLGWKGVVFTIFVSSIAGTLIGLSVILYRKGDMKYALPFGPFLSLAAIIYVFTGGFDFTF